MKNKYLIIIILLFVSSCAMAQITHRPLNADDFIYTLEVVSPNEIIQVDVDIDLDRSARLHQKKDVKIVSSNNSKITVQSYDEAVIILDSCENIDIQGATMYHSTDYSCSSSVIDILNSTSISIRQNDISGCGMIGIYIDASSSHINIANNEIHDCTDVGIYTEAEPFTIYISNNVFYNNGNDIDGTANIEANEYRVVDYTEIFAEIDNMALNKKVGRKANVEITGYYKNDTLCKIEAVDIEFGNNILAYYQDLMPLYYELYIPGSYLEYMDKVYYRYGYPIAQFKTMGGDDETIIEEGDIDQEEIDYIIEQLDNYELALEFEEEAPAVYKEIFVGSETKLIEEINNAVVPTKIVLAHDIELEKAPLLIEGKKDLIVCSENMGVNLYTSNPDSYVISIQNSENIRIESLTMYHDTEFSCVGGVVNIVNSVNTIILNNDISGSGSYGISSFGGNGLHIRQNYIHDCTYWGMDINTAGVIVECNEFVGNGSWNDHYHFGEATGKVKIFNNFYPIKDDYSYEVYQWQTAGELKEVVLEQGDEPNEGPDYVDGAYTKNILHYYKDESIVLIEYNEDNEYESTTASFFVKDNDLVFCEYSAEFYEEYGDMPYYNELDDPWGNEVQAWFRYGDIIQLKVVNNITSKFQLITDPEMIQSYKDHIYMLYSEVR